MPARHGADRVENFLLLGVLQQIGLGPGADGVENQVVGVIGGEDDDLRFRTILGDLPCRGDAVEAGHLDVEQRDMRLPAPRRLHGLGAVRRLRDDLEIRLERQHGGEGAPDQRLILGDQDANAVFGLQ